MSGFHACRLDSSTADVGFQVRADRGRGGTKSRSDSSGSRAAKWVSVDELTRVRPLSGDDRSAAHLRVIVRADPNRLAPPSLSGLSGPSESAEHVWVEAELVDAVPGTPPPGALVSVRISQAAFGAPATSPFGAAAPALGAQMGTDPKGEMLTSVAAGDIYTLAEDGAPPEIGERVLYLRAHRNSYRADRGAHRMRTMQPATVLEVRRPPKSLPVPPSLRMSVPLAPLSPSLRQLRPRA
jgi:hypothetical protein